MGLYVKSKHRLLHNKLQSESPDIMFLQETKCSEEQLEAILSMIWKSGCSIVIYALGLAGGLSLLWNPNKILVWNFFCTPHNISAEFQPLGKNTYGFITNVYGLQQMGEKLLFLQQLQSITEHVHPHLWIMGGYVNLITPLDDKRGGIKRLGRDDLMFKDFIQNN
jgi:hypothetical protein